MARGISLNGSFLTDDWQMTQHAIIINGKIMPVQQCNRLFLTEAYLYGDGLFETIRYEGGSVLYWQQHWERLVAGSGTLELGLPLTQEAALEGISELANKNNLQDAVVRLSLHRNGVGCDYCLQLNPQRKHVEKDAFRMNCAPEAYDRTGPLRFIKSNNYQVYLYFLRLAKAQGFDECLLFNSLGEITEGCLSNLFFVCDGVLCTPKLECGLLPGIIRAQVLARAKDLHIPLEEGSYTIHDIKHASECFVTNSLMHIKPVSQLGEYVLPNCPGEVSCQLSVEL